MDWKTKMFYPTHFFNYLQGSCAPHTQVQTCFLSSNLDIRTTPKSAKTKLNLIKQNREIWHYKNKK